MRSFDKSMVQEWELNHSSSLCPTDLLYFSYLDEFKDDWKGLYPNDDDEKGLWALEILIMTDPKAGAVVSGTGGLRKIRFGKQGKRGGDRVCYSYFPDHNLVLMMMIYRKNAQENLTPAEKEGIKKYLEKTKTWLDQVYERRTQNE